MVSRRRRQLHSGHRDRKEKNHTEQVALEGIHGTLNAGHPTQDTQIELVSLSKSQVKLNCFVGAAVVAVPVSNGRQ